MTHAGDRFRGRQASTGYQSRGNRLPNRHDRTFLAMGHAIGPAFASLRAARLARMPASVSSTPALANIAVTLVHRRSVNAGGDPPVSAFVAVLPTKSLSRHGGVSYNGPKVARLLRTSFSFSWVSPNPFPSVVRGNPWLPPKPTNLCSVRPALVSPPVAVRSGGCQPVSRETGRPQM